MINIVKKIATELELKEYQVNNSINLLFEEECTIPFVSRYRKEMTGTLDEVQLRSIRDRYTYLQELENNKVKYLKVVEEHCQKKPELRAKLPELRTKFAACETKQELEDLYLPFKPKRRTRAQVAKEKGLEPLLTKILQECSSITKLDDVAQDFITPADTKIDPALKVLNTTEALAGAADILAEQIAETAEYRSLARTISFETGQLVSKLIEGAAQKLSEKKGKKVDASKYENYYDYAESIKTAASHRVMAVRRGEAEKILKVNIVVDSDRIVGELKNIVIPQDATAAVKEWEEKIIEDAYKRLLSPAMETEIRLNLKQNAEMEAIRVFSENLENLLLLPPIPNRIVLGVDPGLRTGSKFAVVDETGKLLDHTTLHFDLGGKEGAKTAQSKAQILKLITENHVTCVAIGNGTGSREVNRAITDVIKENSLKDVKRLVVNEAGASVYSTMDIAREEFPDLDPTIRSAVSIARRLQDPLAELVKIDPRSIGVGQYQHDVNVTKLKGSLEEVVESCVNRVGVNVNTASYKLLSYVSGIGPALAKSVVTTRDKNGKFMDRSALSNISGFGPKAFQQAAGFLRVPESINPLDNSAVHPESYEIVQQIITDQKKDIKEIVGKKEVVEAIPIEKYVNNKIGLPTLQDIVKELIKPGRDPRDEGARLMYSDDICELEDLTVGMTLPGTVTNVTNFGAFVDIGVHQDGLVHISELSDQFVDDPSKVVSVGDVVQVRVIDVDLTRRRIGLSRKLGTPAAKSNRRHDKQSNANLSSNSRRGPLKPRVGSNRNNKKGANHRRQESNQNYTMEDLMAKFNQRR